MSVEVKNISQLFKEKYIEIISLDRFIELIKSQNKCVAIEFIIQVLEAGRKELLKIQRYTPFILIKKDHRPVNIYEGKYVYEFSELELNSENLIILNDYAGTSYSFNGLSYIDYPIDKLIEDLNPFGNIEKVKENVTNLKRKLVDYNVFMLVKDVDALIGDINIEDKDIFYIEKYREIVMADRSEEFFENEEYEKSQLDLENEIEQLRVELAEKEKIIRELSILQSTKSENKQKEFIKALLYIHYGAEVAEKPRSHIYDPNMSKKSRDGKIQKDFELHGLEKHLPSGKTLENWLKGIELDTQD
ncbi:hypothetical protein ACM22J_08780 [Glaesserella parasuis]|uniref:hypothetical protein n=1 Tax=Glaesserella parasuis TaxID=738 RepID=UPI0003AC4D27|nr:hypothetical protein HPSSW140_0298 [Glaesserella parasuis SW140]MCT8567700.1 hypothetical protein [Glaesserella parasuis]MCT8672736.1 hypothetical protein [Glaesserella parasuis]MCT8687044.1 hypothetical protein [Glaesserella parasuis]MCT8697543.1 hypothetical protein [Glaesserella parasuis]